MKVEGPLAGPFSTLEELAASACELMTNEPGASNGNYGFEYCALNYYSATNHSYYLSYLSDFRKKLDSATEKTCLIPTVLEDLSHPDAIIVGFDHTHPNNRQFSKPDLRAWARWKPARLDNKNSSKTLDKHLMLFYRERTGECRAYRLDAKTRVVTALRGGRWISIGEAYNTDGDIRMFEGQDWLP